MSLSRDKQKGDTIVEVLLAITIISSVLGGAFVSARRSLDTTTQARERDQGTKLIETQVERLKAVAGDTSVDPAENVFTRTPGHFCLDSLQIPKNLGATVPEDVNADTFSSPQYPDECTLDSGNSIYTAGSSQSTPYYISIQRDATDSNLFTVRARWTRAGGDGREEAKIIYRLYQ